MPEGASIEALVKGTTHVARVAQGRIELDGQVYDSPSAASMAIRKAESWNGMERVGRLEVQRRDVVRSPAAAAADCRGGATDRRMSPLCGRMTTPTTSAGHRRQHVRGSCHLARLA
ncbi:MAG: hypothetical protein ACLQIJ_16685 [Polyangia bacterium]